MVEYIVKDSGKEFADYVNENNLEVLEVQILPNMKAVGFVKKNKLVKKDSEVVLKEALEPGFAGDEMPNYSKPKKKKTTWKKTTKKKKTGVMKNA